MPEPTTSSAATATLAMSTAAVPALTVFGVATGLHADMLLAGFAGALGAMVLLNTVPGSGDTWRDLLRTSGRRVAVAVASSLTAGYLVSLAAALANVPAAALPGAAFVIGGGAQKILAHWVNRFGGGEAKA